MMVMMIRIVVVLALTYLVGCARSAKLTVEQAGQFIGSGAEIAAYDSCKKVAYVSSADTAEVLVLNLTNITSIKQIGSINVTGTANSVAVNQRTGRVAIASSDEEKGEGYIYLYNKALKLVFMKNVSYGPDMLTFNGAGTKILAAIEGEVDENDVDHPGRIAVVDVRTGIVEYADFTALDGTEDALRKRDIHITPGVDASVDFEPEYLTILGQYVYASLQENNAIAKINMEDLSATPRIFPLGLKDHSIPGNGLDASDEDGGYNLKTYKNLYGSYQPDTIASFKQNGVNYIVTANEGDARDEERVEDIILNPTAFPDAAALQAAEVLGRLQVMPCDGCDDYDKLIAFGGRSFSIFMETRRGLKLVYDSGDDFERITYSLLGSDFNSDGEDGGDSRSDNKGPEPEALAIGVINGFRYAFIGLERIGGVMVYDITTPERSRFITYFNNRDFTIPVEDCPTCDIAPESIVFIPRVNSPIPRNLLLVANEVSKTTSVYRIGSTRAVGPLANPTKTAC